jgi:hypothetical protein
MPRRPRELTQLCDCRLNQGRIVASPQIYGQELYSVYIDEHEALFQIPFNALTLVGRPQSSQPIASSASHSSVPSSSTMTRPSHVSSSLSPGRMTSTAQPTSGVMQQQQATSMMMSASPASNSMHMANATSVGMGGMMPSMTPGPTLEQIKMEHSFQLHRLMQQQYREIQVLQQQYAECRLVNPAALAGIQQQLSKLRLVHLSQVQTLKSKQALDLLHKQQQQHQHHR